MCKLTLDVNQSNTFELPSCVINKSHYSFSKSFDVGQSIRVKNFTYNLNRTLNNVRMIKIIN